MGNEGNSGARNVGVRALELSKHDVKSGLYEPDPYFMPMDLTWAHANGSVVVAKIDPKLPKHCDLAHVDAPDPKLLLFNTEVSPNEVAPGVRPTKKPSGKYRLKVAATADNAETVYRTLRIELAGPGTRLRKTCSLRDS